MHKLIALCFLEIKVGLYFFTGVLIIFEPDLISVNEATRILAGKGERRLSYNDPNSVRKMRVVPSRTRTLRRERRMVTLSE